MKRSTLFTTLLVVALLGVLFSGYLSYLNIFHDGCSQSIIRCSIDGKQVLIFGQPTCIYGFFMFLIEAVMAAVALATKSRKLLPWILGLAVVGTLFSLVLSAYEIIGLDALKYGLPACVYGLVIYASLLTIAIIGKKRLQAEAV